MRVVRLLSTATYLERIPERDLRTVVLTCKSRAIHPEMASEEGRESSRGLTVQPPSLSGMSERADGRWKEESWLAKFLQACWAP